MIKTEVSKPSHFCHMFPRLCIWCDCTSDFVGRLISIPGKLYMFPSPLYSHVIMSNDWQHYDSKVVFYCLHIAPPHCHHRSDLFKGFEHILCFNFYYMKCMFKMKSILTIILFAMFGSVCYQPTHSFLKTIAVRHGAIIKSKKNIH